jgi:hypothetical protein
MLVHRDPAYVEAAGAVAASLVEPAGATAGGSKRAGQRRP